MARRRLSASSAFLWLAVLFLSACSQHALRPDLQSATQSPAVELPVPFFNPGDEHYCAPASISSVLAYYNLPANPANVAARVFLPGREGTLQLDVQAYLRDKGLLPFRLKPSMRALLQELEAGRPVLVLQNLGFSWWPQWHYAVVVGFDQPARQLILHSGEQERYRLAYSTFDRTWQRARRWGLVALQSGELPLDIEGRDALNATLDALALNQLRKPVEALLALARRWPDLPMAWFALGNALHQEGEYAAARSALIKAVERGQGVEALNNLAWVSDRLGCHRSARELVACAREVYPKHPVLEATHRELALKEEQSRVEAANCADMSRYCPSKAAGKAQ